MPLPVTLRNVFSLGNTFRAIAQLVEQWIVNDFCLFFCRRLLSARGFGARALVCRRRRRRRRRQRARVVCLNESKEVEEEKVNTHHEHIFFVLFFPQKSEQLGRKEEGFPVFCRRHSYSRTQITDTEERDDGDENGVEQRQTGQSSLDFEQQQQQQQQQH